MSVSSLLVHQSFSTYPPTFPTITMPLSFKEMAFEAIKESSVTISLMRDSRHRLP